MGDKKVNGVSEASPRAPAPTPTPTLPFTDKLVVFRHFSKDAARLIPDGELDYVYLDARHDYEGVMGDLERYYPKVRTGGILAGHDFVDNDFVLLEYGGEREARRPQGRQERGVGFCSQAR